MASTVNVMVRKAIDTAFSNGIESLYAAAIAKVAGGESVDEAMKEYHAGIVLEAVKLRARVLVETGTALGDDENFRP